MDMKTCSKCGNSISENATICPVCGEGRVAPKNKIEQKLSGVKPVENTGKPKKRIIVFLLSLVGWGVVYYYLGYQDKAIQRIAMWIRPILYFITLIGAIYGLFLILYATALHLYDIVYLTFFVKYDAYGNEIKW